MQFKIKSPLHDVPLMNDEFFNSTLFKFQVADSREGSGINYCLPHCNPHCCCFLIQRNPGAQFSGLLGFRCNSRAFPSTAAFLLLHFPELNSESLAQQNNDVQCVCVFFYEMMQHCNRNSYSPFFPHFFFESKTTKFQSVIGS